MKDAVSLYVTDCVMGLVFQLEGVQKRRGIVLDCAILEGPVEKPRMGEYGL